MGAAGRYYPFLFYDRIEVFEENLAVAQVKGGATWEK